jgi:glycolate oxidase
VDFISELRSEIYGAAVKLEGVITGEHGIGRIRVRSVNHYISEEKLELMRKIKRTFDPNNILNAGVKIPL